MRGRACSVHYDGRVSQTSTIAGELRRSAMRNPVPPRHYRNSLVHAQACLYSFLAHHAEGGEGTDGVRKWDWVRLVIMYLTQTHFWATIGSIWNRRVRHSHNPPWRWRQRLRASHV